MDFSASDDDVDVRRSNDMPKFVIVAWLIAYCSASSSHSVGVATKSAVGKHTFSAARPEPATPPELAALDCFASGSQ
jgi:hypothetical protein